MVEPRENRVHMYLSNDEMNAIDDWRFANRVATRSEAIRRLCQLGLILDSRLEDLFSARMNQSEAFIDFFKALGLIDEEGKVVRELSDGSEIERAAAGVISVVESLSSSIRELYDHAYIVQKSKSLGEVVDSMKETTMLYDRILGRNNADRTTKE